LVGVLADAEVPYIDELFIGGAGEPAPQGVTKGKKGKGKKGTRGTRPLSSSADVSTLGRLEGKAKIKLRG
jgi:hypothetical protein